MAALLVGPGRASAQDERGKPAPRRGYEHLQIEALGGGDALMLWVRPVSGGHDLLAAVRGAEGGLEPTRRLNATPAAVRFRPSDATRPALASDGTDRVGAAWFDREGRLFASRSDDRGRTFAPPRRVDRGKGRPEHAFVHAAFDPSGALHVVWIDTRDAPSGSDTPAHVMHAAWTDRGVRAETSVTEGHFDTASPVRPFVHADRFGLDVLFRAVEEGRHDVFVVRHEHDGDWTTPVRVGPPAETTDADALGGPIADGPIVLWREPTRSGDRIVATSGKDVPLRRVHAVDDPGHSLRDPRTIGEDFLLVPGDPAGILLRRTGGAWDVVRADLPAWCSDLLRIRDQFLMIGDQEGNLEVQALPLVR